LLGAPWSGNGPGSTLAQRSLPQNQSVSGASEQVPPPPEAPAVPVGWRAIRETSWTLTGTILVPFRELQVWVPPDGARTDTKQSLPGMDRLDRPPGRWGSPTRSVAYGRNRALWWRPWCRRALPMLPKPPARGKGPVRGYYSATNNVGSERSRRWIGGMMGVVETWLGTGLVSHSPETCCYVGIASVLWSFSSVAHRPLVSLIRDILRG